MSLFTRRGMRKTNQWMPCIVNFCLFPLCAWHQQHLCMSACIPDPRATYSKQLTGHEFYILCAGKWSVGSGVHPPLRGGNRHLATPPGVGGNRRVGGADGHGGGGMISCLAIWRMYKAKSGRLTHSNLDSCSALTVCRSARIWNHPTTESLVTDLVATADDFWLSYRSASDSCQKASGQLCPACMPSLLCACQS